VSIHRGKDLIRHRRACRFCLAPNVSGWNSKTSRRGCPKGAAPARWIGFLVKRLRCLLFSIQDGCWRCLAYCCLYYNFIPRIFNLGGTHRPTLTGIDRNAGQGGALDLAFDLLPFLRYVSNISTRYNADKAISVLSYFHDSGVGCTSTQGNIPLSIQVIGYLAIGQGHGIEHTGL